MTDFLSPTPIADDYVHALREDLADAHLLRFAMAYVTNSGLGAIGINLLAAALRQPNSLGVASLACACGFEPFLTLQEAVGATSTNLRYFLDPGIADVSDPNVALLHSKLVYIVRADGSAVVYLGSHNWSGRALGGAATRNAEASYRFEMPFAPDDLTGMGTGLGAQVNRHILEAHGLGACLPVVPVNRPVFEDWFRVRCQRPADLELDSYAVLVGICDDKVGGRRDPHFWLVRAARGTSVYLQCHEEDEGRVVRKRQERVLLMVWADAAAFAAAKPPVLLFCKVTRQSAGEESTYEGTSGGDITNFNFVLWDPKQNTARASGSPAAARLQATTRTGRPFEYFVLESASPGASASSYDGASPRYQHYLQVYEVVLPEWMLETMEPPPDGAEPLVWRPESFALATTRRVPPEESRLYRASEVLADQIVSSLREDFALDFDQAVALPTSGETDPRKLVRAVGNPLHDACIDAETEALGDTFYALAPAGSIAMDLQRRLDDSDVEEVVPRVQELFGERLRELLKRLGVEHPDVEEWERRPKTQRPADSSRRPRQRVQDQAEPLRPSKVASTAQAEPSEQAIRDALRAAIREERAKYDAPPTREDLIEPIIATACIRLGVPPDDTLVRARLLALIDTPGPGKRR